MSLCHGALAVRSYQVENLCTESISVWWWKWKWPSGSGISTLDSLVTLSGSPRVMERLGDSAWLEELRHWGLALSVYRLTGLSAHPRYHSTRTEGIGHIVLTIKNQRWKDVC